MSNIEFKEEKQSTVPNKPRKLSTYEGNRLTHRRSQPFLNYMQPEFKTSQKPNFKERITPRKNNQVAIVQHSKASPQKNKTIGKNVRRVAVAIIRPRDTQIQLPKVGINETYLDDENINEVTTERSDHPIGFDRSRLARKSSIANESLVRHEEKSQFSRSVERLPHFPQDSMMSMEETEVPNAVRVNKKTFEPGSNIVRSSSAGKQNIGQALRLQVTSNVLHLDLSCQKLTVAPMIDDSSQLVSFKVDCNFLTCLPPRIGYIKSLKVLSANKNRLYDMPESLILSQVEELYLNHNLIERLPLKIGQMQYLKVLHIQSNPMISLPRSFNFLKAAVKFDWLDYISSLEDIKYLCGQTKNGMVNFLQAFLFNNQLTKLHQIRQEKGFAHKICKQGHLYLLHSIQTSLFDWNQQQDYLTPLMMALNAKQHEVVKFLLKVPQQQFGAHSVRYGSALHLALRTNQYKTALVLFKKASQEGTASLKDSDGNTPLHLLFSNFGPMRDHEHALKLAQALAETATDVNAQNKQKQTPLHIAVAYGNIKAVNFAIKFNQKQTAFNFDSVGGERQWTLLHYAIEFTNLQMVTALLNVTKQFFTTDINGKTAMEMCPYSSPIYKLIRARSRTQFQLSDNITPQKIQHPVTSCRNSTTRAKVIQLPSFQQQDVPPSMPDDDGMDDFQFITGNVHITSFDHSKIPVSHKPQQSICNRNSVVLASYESLRSESDPPKAPLQQITTVLSMNYDSQPLDTQQFYSGQSDQREYLAQKALKAFYEPIEINTNQNNNWDTKVSCIVDEPVLTQKGFGMLTMEKAVQKVNLMKKTNLGSVQRLYAFIRSLTIEQMQQLYQNILENGRLPFDQSSALTQGQVTQCLHELLNAFLIADVLRQRQQFQKQKQKQLDESYLDQSDDESPTSNLKPNNQVKQFLHGYRAEMDYVSVQSNVRKSPKETKFKKHNF